MADDDGKALGSPASPLAARRRASPFSSSDDDDDDGDALPPPATTTTSPHKRARIAVEAEPPSLAAQTKTADGTDRKRIYRACEVCRRKKIRCDGTKPCKPCTRMAETCVFLDDASKSTYSKRYVEGLEQRLKRMEDLLASNANAGVPPSPASETAPSSSLAASEGHSTATGVGSAAFAAKRNGTASANFQMSLVALGTDESCAGRLQTDEEGNKRYIGPSAALGILCDAASLALGSSAHNGLERSILPPSAELRILSGSTGISLASVVPSYPTADGVSLPPRDLADALLQTFFDSIHPIFPILNERETKYKCSLLYDTLPPMPASGSGPSRASVRSDPLFLATIFAVFACASRVLKDPRVCTTVPSAAEAANEGYADVYQHQFDTRASSTTPQGGEQAGSGSSGAPHPPVGPNFALAGLSFFERAQVLSLHRPSDTRLEQVQCSALLALYMAACNCAARSWILCGTALRVAIDIGIHRALIPLDMSVAELEMRRRVWACVYVADRLLGIALGRPLGVEDINHDQMRPSLSLESGNQKLMPGFNLLIDLIQMQALLCRCVTRLNNARSQGDMEAVKEFRAQALGFEPQLAEWLARVPAHLRHPSSETGSGSAWRIQATVLTATLHSAEMLLYRSLLQDSQKKTITTSSSTSSSSLTEDDQVLGKATRTALRIIHLAPQMATLAATHFTLEYSQQLLVAASFLALNAYRHRGANADQLFVQADEGLLGLRLLEPNFPGARNLRKALSRVIRALRHKCGMVPPPPPPHSSPGKVSSSSGRKRGYEGDAKDRPHGTGRAGSLSRHYSASNVPLSSAVSTDASSKSAPRALPPAGVLLPSPDAGPSGIVSDDGGNALAQGGSDRSLLVGSSPLSAGGQGPVTVTATHHPEFCPADELQPQHHDPDRLQAPSEMRGAVASHQQTMPAPTETPTNTTATAMPPSSSTPSLLLEGATLSTDFHFDTGGFDPFAALELFSSYDLSTLLGVGDEVVDLGGGGGGRGGGGGPSGIV